MRSPNPLQWPSGWERTGPHEREIARFKLTLASAVYDLLRELHLMGAVNVVVTSDLPTNSRGLPYSSGKCEDPGIAVWCVVGGQDRVFACDHWTTPAGNARAVGKTIEALRGLHRWGAADLVNRAFAGFQALPAGAQEMAPNPASTPRRHWAEVLGVPRETSDGQAPSRSQLLNWARVRHREAIRTAHPDAGGTHERAADLNAALQEAVTELGGQ